MSLGIHVHVHGPLSTPEARAVVARLRESVQHEVALEAGIAWVSGLVRSFRDPTPYYWTRIDVDDRGSYSWAHDNGVIYGHWLEGTGSRNSPVTRFPGYHQARETTRAISHRVPVIVGPIVRAAVAEMGG